MRIVSGNLWDFHNIRLGWIVIPTNLGWKRDGSNVMRKGLALQASRRFPKLTMEYGEHCKKVANQDRKGFFDPRKRLVLLPTKPLIVERPHMSWDQKSDSRLVLKSLWELYDWTAVCQEEFGLPLLGTGDNELDRGEILSMTLEVLEKIPWGYLYT